MSDKNTDTWFWVVLICAFIGAILGNQSWPLLLSAAAIIGAIGAATKTICAAIAKQAGG